MAESAVSVSVAVGVGVGGGVIVGVFVADRISVRLLTVGVALDHERVPVVVAVNPVWEGTSETVGYVTVALRRTVAESSAFVDVGEPSLVTVRPEGVSVGVDDGDVDGSGVCVSVSNAECETTREYRVPVRG